MKQKVSNPWGLTCAEVDAMDVVCKVGSQTDAAKRLGVKLNTLKFQLLSVRRKMGIESNLGGGTLLASNAFAIWRHTEGREVAA